MAQATVVYWRDIPAQVTIKQGRATAKRELAPRFQEAIDLAAMRAGAIGTDAYLNDWRRGPAFECTEDIDGEADGWQARLEDEYDDKRIAELVQNKGYDDAEKAG